MSVTLSIVPIAKTEAYKIFYYGVALDDAGAMVASTGTARSPRRIDVITSAEWTKRFKRTKTPPLYKQKWFWGAVSGVVAVGSVVTFFIIRPENGEGPRLPTEIALIRW